MRFDLGLDYLEGTGKDIPGGRSSGAKAEDENVQALLGVIRPGGVWGEPLFAGRSAFCKGSHFFLHFPGPPRLFSTPEDVGKAEGPKAEIRNL